MKRRLELELSDRQAMRILSALRLALAEGKHPATKGNALETGAAALRAAWETAAKAPPRPAPETADPFQLAQAAGRRVRYALAELEAAMREAEAARTAAKADPLSKRK